MSSSATTGAATATIDADPLLTALEELSDQQRAVWVACELNGYSAAQFADVRGVSASTARTHLRRARDRLAPVLDPFAVPGLSRSEAETILEEHAAERYGLELAPDSETPEWYDATEPDGTPIEIKGCAIRVPDGDSRRRGRWLIRWENHRELERAGGRYLVGVYDAREEILASACLSAERVSELLEGAVWWRSPEHDDDAAQICYSEIFPGLDDRLRAAHDSR